MDDRPNARARQNPENFLKRNIFQKNGIPRPLFPEQYTLIFEEDMKKYLENFPNSKNAMANHFGKITMFFMTHNANSVFSSTAKQFSFQGNLEIVLKKSI